MSTQLVHHSANRDHEYPSNSLRAIRYCLDIHAKVVEVDIVPLVGGDFALLHDNDLSKSTNGQGQASLCNAEQISQLHYTKDDAIDKEHVGLLSQLVALVEESPSPDEVQLDLKPFAPLTDAILNGLIRQVEPIQERIRVTSVADWALRRLKLSEPKLRLGFDPVLYIDWDVQQSRGNRVPPSQIGAFGYLDDHPLAYYKWGAETDYLELRAEALLAQVPDQMLWCIRATLLNQVIKDGFDWISYLRVRGAEVATWTLNADSRNDLTLAHELVRRKIDRISTDNPPQLAKKLGNAVSF